MVERFVVGAVDIRADDVASLNGHVVNGSRDGTGADGARVLGGPGDDDGVAVGVAEVDGDEGEGAPGVDVDAGPEA